MIDVPTPVYVVPLQQKRYCPVNEFHKRMMLGSLSSCSKVSNVVTVNEQVAVLPEASVAVQVTVVTPTAKHDPEGGLQTTTTPGQLSLAVVVKLTTVQTAPPPPQS